MVAAAAAASCVVAFWLLALAIRLMVQGSGIDPVAGVVVGLLLAIPVYVRLRPVMGNHLRAFGVTAFSVLAVGAITAFVFIVLVEVGASRRRCF